MEIYIVVANSKNEPVKIFDLGGNIVKEIDLKKAIFFIDSYNDKNNNYLLLGCGKSCKSYNIDENDLLYSYYTEKQGLISTIVISESEDLVKIMGLDFEKKVIKIWNFYTGNHLFDIKLGEPKNVSGLCLWDNTYLLVGINNEIGLVNLKGRKLVDSLSINKPGNVCSIKKIRSNGQYFLISHNSNECLLLWKYMIV